MADHAASTSQGQISNSTVHSTSKFRAYAKEVDRALKSFETTNEWADLIAALGKLCKVLQGSSKNFSEVPKSVIVAKRLSQCLHPALPSGVHLKALEVYKQLFTILQRGDNMSKELYLYAIGLFPLMDHCGIKVKTELLTIFEQFFLPLGDSLKPSLPGFIATILIGLEEGTEFFARSNDLLNRLIDAVGNEGFFASLWEAVLHSPSVRLPALYFVNSKFDKRRPLGEQFLIIAGGDHVDHMIAALCAVAEDFSGPILMHRHLLDFLLSAFPLNSAHVTQADFVQLLRRCLFIVLRRDMSLTRRIYQWLLNKSDSASSVLPTSGEEEEVDIVFFDTYSLPLIKLSIVEFLKLDTVEIPMPKSVMGAAGGAYEGPKEHVTQFTEVRLCRALQYFLDRPPFGIKILEEVLSIFLEYCCIQDQNLISSLTKKCEELDSLFSPDWSVRIEMSGINLSSSERDKRLDEIKKNLNALLNNLDVGYIWNFLSRLLKKLLDSKYKNESDEEDINLTDEERQKRDFQEEKRKEHIVLFPVMVSFCLQNVQLDNHSDIRSVYLPELLNTILSSITQHGCDKFSRDNLVALLSIARSLLGEINQSIGTVENEEDEKLDNHSRVSSSARSLSTKSVKKQKLEEQKLIEACFKSCYGMIVTVCDWYVTSRDRDKTGVLCAASAFLRDFGDFPIYCYEEKDLEVFNAPTTGGTELPAWIMLLLKVIDVSTWNDGSLVDFDVRSRIVDLLIFVYIRSVILIDQHKAISGRDIYECDQQNDWASTKTTTTILLKPMLTEGDIIALDSSKIFENIGKILWHSLSLPEDSGEHQTSACLLHRLHSRNTNDPSSDIESIIVTDLCAFDKALCSDACRRFRKLWTLTRSSINENVYDGIPYKSFNRIIMELLGTVADDSLNNRNSSLKTVATAWFIDCAKHGDLPRVFQMVGTMLLNPATARISIQYLHIQTRLTKENIKSMPDDVNCISLVTETERQSLHHVLHDATTAQDFTPLSPVDCTTNEEWIRDLKTHILSPPQSNGYGAFNDSMRPMPPTPAPIKSHKRTISDIPQFDEDNESLEEMSIDSNSDPDVIDCVNFLIDFVCDQLDTDDRFAQAAKAMNISESSTELPALNKFVVSGGSPNLRDRLKETSHYRRSLPAAFPASLPNDADKREEQSKSLLIEAGSLESKVPPQPPLRLPDNIKRVKCGHRRQDSLQESIFSTPTQDLRLFDPSELPKLIAPGDGKQPLLEEAQAHMLLYVESPEMVDLRRAESIFRILSSLLRSNRGAALGKMMVHCMIFNNTSTLPQAFGGGVNLLVEYLNRHYRSIQGEDFWFKNEDNQGDIAKPRHCSYFELFCAISLHYLRSYFVNSPTSPVSEKDLSVSWDCKIAVLDFFTDLLREIIVLITEIKSRELVNSILSIYRQTKLQRCLISFLLTAVPPSRTPTDVVSISADIAEFNTRSTRNSFGDTAFAYHRALLDFASIVISFEYQTNVGLHIYSEQNLPISVEKSFVVHKLNYSSTQNRSNLRHPHVLVVELKLFISVIVNALQKLPERHELWLQFLINILPFLEKALPTICIHVVDQLCRNIDTCVNYAYGYTGATTFDCASIAEEALIISSPRKRASLTPNTEVYPENYSLIAMEALTTIMHFCMLETPSLTSSSTMGGVIATSSIASKSMITPAGGSPTHSMNSFAGSNVSNSQSTAGASNTSGAVVSAINMIPGTKGATEMLGNLFSKVFTSSDTSGSVISAVSKYDQKSAADIWRQARNELLKKFPHFLSTICDVWAVAQKGVQPRLPIGTGEQLKQRVFDLINPVAKRHPNALLNALSVVWMNRASIKASKPDADQLCFVYSDEQLTIANLLLELKVLPFQHAIFAIAECLKEVYKSTGCKTTTVTALASDKSTICEVAMLELLHGCVRLVPSKDLHDCWSALNFLFSEAPAGTLSPRGVFLEFKILDDFVRICGSQAIIDDKQTSRAVQDACQKLTDAVNFIVGWQLETTSWLKRTVVVRQDTGSVKSGETTPMMETKSLATSIGGEPATSSIRGSTMSLATRNTQFSSHYDVSGNSASQLVLTANQSGSDKKSTSNLRASVKDSNNNKKDPYYSTQALFLLAESLAELIDSITKSEDKEKLLQTLQAVWGNALPYLKVKSAKNARFFLASSQFLASMSSFTYMRSVWKKSALDLLFDSSFFKMDIHSLKQWLIVIDNLMTNEKACFKELMAKIPTTPNTGITSLMINKDQEYESRAQALKRLAFVLLSSQMEQYGPQLPDIQERLSDNLRLSQVPLVHAQVFTCFRVLLIRFPPLNFVSIWPAMATELVQVLLQIETQLLQIANDSVSIASNSTGDDLRCSRDDQWMQLYLAASKLLETLCTLPSGYVSQFQTCHWAFISSLVTNSTTDPFVPFAVRIHQLLCEKYGALSIDEQSLHSASLQNIKTLTSFSELRPFFHALASQHTTVVAGLTGNTIQQECFLHDATSINGSMTRKNAIARLEHSLYVDFAEHLQL